MHSGTVTRALPFGSLGPRAGVGSIAGSDLEITYVSSDHTNAFDIAPMLRLVERCGENFFRRQIESNL